MVSRLTQSATVWHEHFLSYLSVHLCRPSSPACPRGWNCWLLCDVPHPALVEVVRQISHTVTSCHTLIMVKRSQQLQCSHPCQHLCCASSPVSHSSNVWCCLIMVLVKEPFNWSPCFRFCFPTIPSLKSNQKIVPQTQVRAPCSPSYHTPVAPTAHGMNSHHNRSLQVPTRAGFHLPARLHLTPSTLPTFPCAPGIPASLSPLNKPSSLLLGGLCLEHNPTLTPHPNFSST